MNVAIVIMSTGIASGRDAVSTSTMMAYVHSVPHLERSNPLSFFIDDYHEGNIIPGED